MIIPAIIAFGFRMIGSGRSSLKVDVCDVRVVSEKAKKMPVYFMDGPIRTSIEVQLYHTRTDREWEEQFMHQALEEAQLENSKLGNFAARKRCYQFRWQEICIRHLLKVYTVYRGAVLSNVE